MELKKNLSLYSRRNFLAISSLSAAGLWAAYGQAGGLQAIEAVSEETPSVDPAAIPCPTAWTDNGITAAWLGHSTVLLNFYGVTILTDPVLFRRIGANTALGTVGPKRLVGAPLKPAQLPDIDLVVISHAHMDHLDPASLRALPGRPRAVTATATTDLLQGTRIRQAQALSWGESCRVHTAHGEVLVRAFEVRHWGARWRFDRYRGYNGYVLEREGKRVLFGGDTAMCNTFADLRKYGPYELAIMPIGAYEPWVQSHCNPEEAVAMANQAGAEGYFLPVHHMTFPLGREGQFAPIERLQAHLDKARLGWTDVGQTFALPA